MALVRRAKAPGSVWASLAALAAVLGAQQGDDTLAGGAGKDNLRGGAGTDKCQPGSPGLARGDHAIGCEA